MNHKEQTLIKDKMPNYLTSMKLLGNYFKIKVLLLKLLYNLLIIHVPFYIDGTM